MLYYGLAGLLGLIALAVCALGLRVGGRLGWLVPWLRGNLVLALLVVAVALGLAAFDLSRFEAIERGKQVATLEFREVAEQQFEAQIQIGGTTRVLTLYGDMWELDAQVIRWSGLAAALGLTDGYRLNRLTGRFVALEQQEGSIAVQPVPLNDAPAWRDVWGWIDRLAHPPLVYSDAFVVRFVPLVDEARFALEVGPTGFSPIPLNVAAAASFSPAD